MQDSSWVFELCGSQIRHFLVVDYMWDEGKGDKNNDVSW